MTRVIFIDDCVNDERYYVTLREVDKNKISENWYNKDKLLVELINTKFFEGKTTWVELRPIHFKFLIMRNFIHSDQLKSNERLDPENPVIASLYFLIGGLLRSISEHADTNVEFMKIVRISISHINFDFHASLALELDVKTSTKEVEEIPFKVVVDNTKCPGNGK
jgi:hypothetical protein